MSDDWQMIIYNDDKVKEAGENIIAVERYSENHDWKWRTMDESDMYKRQYIYKK